MSPGHAVGDLPDDPGVGPATDGAVQAHALLLPHGVGARLDHKLWRVHQAVLVHAFEVFPVFMDLQRGESGRKGGRKGATLRRWVGRGRGTNLENPRKTPARSLINASACTGRTAIDSGFSMRRVLLVRVIISSHSANSGVFVGPTTEATHNWTTPLGHCLQKHNS